MARLLASDHGWVVPPQDVMIRARRVQWLRRRASPSRLTRSFLASAERWYGRVARPTGLFVLVVGPDGAGKSSLAEALPELCDGPVPALASICTGGPDFSLGQARCSASLRLIPTSRTRGLSTGPAASLASLGYHWLDFFLGGWLRITPLKIRSGLIVLERGWWDIAIDPRRYRIAAPAALVQRARMAPAATRPRDRPRSATRRPHGAQVGDRAGGTRSTDARVAVHDPRGAAGAVRRRCSTGGRGSSYCSRGGVLATHRAGIREIRSGMGGAPPLVLAALVAATWTESDRSVRSVRLPAGDVPRQAGLGDGESSRDRLGCSGSCRGEGSLPEGSSSWSHLTYPRERRSR